ncbi:MAG TPA: ParB N-terminal domain-containing protein [Negativicutes bacterium]|nr:ParB N-terminal domain-containing protein [Negativicutes bacterium]
MSKKIFTVKISELQINTYVRKEINQDHALMLALLLENKVKLPPIQVTSALIVIDGRHRIEAHQINNLAEIEVELVDIKDENELISAAYRANMGGSLPPTPQDTEHTVRTLLDRGMPKKDIPDSLGLPVNMVRSYINKIASKVKRQNLQKAEYAVIEKNVTRAQAAEEFGVDEQDLKRYMQEGRKKKKSGLSDIERNIQHLHQSLSNQTTRTFKRLSTLFEDGDASAKDVQNFLDMVESRLQAMTRLNKDRRTRFDVQVNENAPKVSEAKSA